MPIHFALGDRLAAGVCAAALLLALAPATQAADPVSPAPAYTDWSGAYLGIEGSASGSYGGQDFGPTTIGRRSVTSFKSGDSTGRSDSGVHGSTGVAGGFAGWNAQSGPWVYGIELALDATNLKRPVSSTTPGLGYETLDPPVALIRTKTDVFGSLRARVGFSYERALIYGSFGLAGANARMVATYPDFAGGGTIARKDLTFVGFTVGAGMDYAVTPNLVLGLDYRYFDLGRSGSFGLGTVPGPDGGPVGTRAAFDSHQMMGRLTWYPGGLALSPEQALVSLHAPDNGETGRFSLHGQATLIAQGVPNFAAPYSGEQSLIPSQTRQTTTATAFLGYKLMEGTELYYNPEFSQGFGLSRTLGVAGFVNGEAQKAGAPFPKLRSNRYFVRQTFGLGGETEDVPDGPNQVETRRDIERITVVAGKFAMGDFFDGNVYAHDPRIDFMNWGLWASAAWDFPANLPGFTQGLMMEYNRAEFAVRAAYTQVPKRASSDVFDRRIFERAGRNIEFEGRHVLPWLQQPGKLRIGLFSNDANSARYGEVVALTEAGIYADVNDAVAGTRRTRNKHGYYLNLEQALTPELGLFARYSSADGRNENVSFTDIDRSVSGGLSLKGAAWGRPLDTVGVGLAQNELSQGHRAYFNTGGLGLLIGDGRLSYAPERAFEAYYAMALTTTLAMSLNYQHVENLAYNRDRGPADFFAARMHVDF